MSSDIERVPQVIPIDVSSDECGDDEENNDLRSASTSAAAMHRAKERTLTAGFLEKLNAGCSSPESILSNSDDNALFESDDDEDDNGYNDQQETNKSKLIAMQSRLGPYTNQKRQWRSEKSQPDLSNALAISSHTSRRFEKLLKSCVSLMNTTNKSKKPTEDEERSDVDSWALQNGLGFYMSNKFYCYFSQGSCKASFTSSALLSRHLYSVHKTSKDIVEKSCKQVSPDKKLARWLISSKVSIRIITSSYFDDFIGALYSQNEKDYVVSQARIEKIIRVEHNNVLVNLSDLLQKIEHISLVISQWNQPEKDGSQQEILLLSIFFIDEHWVRRSYVIAAEPLSANETKSTILQKIAIVLVDLGILERIYTVTCYETKKINEASIIAFLQKVMGQNKISLNEDRVYSTLLDQVIIQLRIELLASLKLDCEPLKKVIREIENCNCNIFFKGMQPYSIGIMKAYLNSKRKHQIDCAMKSYIINETDEECMEQIVMLDSDLAFVSNWLYDTPKNNITIANKAYGICCELGNLIKKLAELKTNKRSFSKSTTAKAYEISDAVAKAAYMRKPLETMHKILNNYRCKLERGRAHVEAFVYDSFTYDNAYFNTSKTPALVKQAKDIGIILDDISNHNDKRHRTENIVDLLKLNCKEKRNHYDSEQATSSNSNVIIRKRRRSNRLEVIPEPAASNNSIAKEIETYQQMQEEYLKKHPDTNIPSFDHSPSKIFSMLSDYSAGGQINFWKQVDCNQMPMLAEHTRKTFAIPTTSQECIEVFEPFKRLCIQLSDSDEQGGNSQCDFICKRALLSIWNNEFDLFKD